MDQDLLHSRDRPESKASACPVFRGFQSKVEGVGQRQLINKSVNEEDNFREQITYDIIKQDVMIEKNWRAGVVREGFPGPLNLKGEFGIQRRDKPCKDLKAKHSIN